MIVDLDNPKKWPSELVDYLARYHDLFIDWETGPVNTQPWQYDKFIFGLQNVLKPYSLVGWHCTRLTNDEIQAIESFGLQMPDKTMLFRRIDDRIREGTLSGELGQMLKARNQADEEYRKGRLYFCFFPPRIEGESGVARFFRHWGGDALYNSHEDDPVTGIAISSIGYPCIVEAEVPIKLFRPSSFLGDKLARRYAISRGYQTNEPIDHEDAIVYPLHAEKIRRIIRFPSPDFVNLTDCDKWQTTLHI
jgi:hypothetical protein